MTNMVLEKFDWVKKEHGDIFKDKLWKIYVKVEVLKKL